MSAMALIGFAEVFTAILAMQLDFLKAHLKAKLQGISSSRCRLLKRGIHKNLKKLMYYAIR